MTCGESDAVQIPTLKARIAQLPVQQADATHVLKMHAARGIAEARAQLGELKARSVVETTHRAFDAIDRQLQEVAWFLRELRCGCAQVDRVVLDIGAGNWAEGAERS